MKQRAEYEAEVVDGLVSMANGEIAGLRAGRARVHGVTQTAVRFDFDGDPKALRGLKLSQAVYSVERYDIPRPLALLGDANFRRFIAQIERVLKLNPSNAFKSFHVAAAGSQSSVMGRIKDEIGKRIALSHDDEGGDLLIRIIPNEKGGWRTLVRLTPRPLATRAWRVQDVPGALNATVASAMVQLVGLHADDIFVNLGSGSGSIVIERCAAALVHQAIGIEIDPVVLGAARANIDASGYGKRIALLNADMRQLPLAEASVDALACDLPFGQRVGSHADNLTLYPAALAEAARIAKSTAKFVIITHEIKLMEQTLAAQSAWRQIGVTPIVLRGLHPRIYLLARL